MRGLALFGILVVNAPLFFWPLQVELLGATPTPTVLDDAANTLLRFAFEGKFFTIFSLLFGIGVALQLGRGHPPRLIMRRLLVLALFGAVHVTLFWWGDILLHYAILGVTLVLTRRWSPRRLVRAALVLLMVPVVLQVGLAALGSLAATSGEGAAAFAEAAAESDAAFAAQAETALSVYGGGDIAAAAALRWSDWPAALASVGRLALSTYLAQSLVMTTLAYAFGFGLYGSVSHAQALGLALVLFALQVPIAVLYTRRYRFGPAEWLWRAGRYGRRPG